MTDEIKTDAENALNEVKTAIGTLETEEKTGLAWFEKHSIWLVAVGCLVIGVLIGHAFTIHH